MTYLLVETFVGSLTCALVADNSSQALDATRRKRAPAVFVDIVVAQAA